MNRSPSLCAEARVQMPDGAQEASFWIEAGESLFRLGALGGTSGAPSGGEVSAGGRLRICGLTRGEYRLSVYSGDINGPGSFGVTQLSVADKDVAGVQVGALPRTSLPGTIVWSGEPPPNPVEGQVSIRLNSMDRSVQFSGGQATLSIPGDFELTDKTPFYEAPPGTLLGEYGVTVDRLPQPVYIRDMFYGGTSVLHRPLALGSELNGSALRIVLEHNGGTVRALVRNQDGDPIADATVVAVPKAAATYMQLAETRAVGTTDQNGEYSTAAMAPGEYLVMALEGDYADLSPETIKALFNARSQAKEVIVGPNTTTNLELEGRRLER
jgi:hypothetical protein